MRKFLVMAITAMSTIGTINCSFPEYAVALENENVVIEGQSFQMNKNDKYSFTTYSSSKNSGLGSLEISGNITKNESSEIENSYTASSSDDEIVFSYTYDDTDLNKLGNGYSIADDKSKKVDSLKLDEAVGKGVIIIQSSYDGETWATDKSISDYFDSQTTDNVVYTPNNVQLSTGCYFQVIVAYEKEKLIKEKLGPDEYDRYRYIEKYEFYLSDGTECNDETTQNYTELGAETFRVDEDGYTNPTTITSNDLHYGWQMGSFKLTGYSAVKKSGDQITFIKELGDNIELYFEMSQDINNLNNQDGLHVVEDKDGFDEALQMEKQDFGKGMLVITRVDEHQSVASTIPYKNYLLGCSTLTTRANIKLNIWEEGDYTVVLDYKIKNDKAFLNNQACYKKSFTFSIRNGNSVVYPIDINDQFELKNNQITANGFKLQTANSKYLDIDVERTEFRLEGNIYKSNIAESQLADTTDEYTDEGVYTITVTNPTTGSKSVKTIYVGESSIIKVLSTQKYSLEEINEKLSEGYKLQADGSFYKSELKLKKPNNIQKNTQNKKCNSVIGLVKGLKKFSNLWKEDK